MTSIFDLKTNVSELESSNQGTSRMQYDQIAPSRDVTTNNFPNGSIHCRFQNTGQKRWIPSKSYLRIRCQLAKADGTPLKLDDNISPNMGLCAALFQSMEFRINDKTVSRISDFVPQIDALETRLYKSKAWLDGIGSSVNFWDYEYKKRQSAVSSDASNQLVSEVTTDRLDLGYDDATNTFAIAADTGILTFAQGGGAVLPTLANVWKVGDEIELDSGGVIGTVRYRISALTGAQTLQLNNYQTIAIAASTNRFRRIRTVVSSNDHTRKVSNFELCWTPPLSIFKQHQALPNIKADLILNPQTSNSYQKYAIESLGVDKIPNVATTGNPTANSQYIFNIVDMYLYCNVVEGPRLDNITYLLDLKQTRCQSDSIDSSSFQQKNMDISPSTYAISVAYQDGRAGTNTRISSTKFKSYNANLTSSEELKLNRFFINYSGQNLPAPDASPEYSDNSIDYTVQRYTESQIYSGAFFDTGGGESLVEWQERGPYYNFFIPRDGSDRSTRCTVHQQFNNADVANMRVLLFDHSKQVARIRVQDGRVVDVQVEDV